MTRPIYLDYAATTPADPLVIKKMQECLEINGNFGNAASLHYYGSAAANAIDQARHSIAESINAAPSGIIFTSGATEANNLAIKGLAYAYQDKGRHIITCQTEHKSVLEPCKFLESQGFLVSYLPVQSNGLIDLEELKSAIRPDTIIISIMHVNNEIGVVQDLEAIGELAHKHNIIFHSDAAQSIGKVKVDVKACKIDAMSLSAHKCYGPKGVGVLYIRRPKIKLQAQLHGGGHEYQLRSGTLPTHQIVGMAEAYRLANQYFAEEQAKIQKFKSQLRLGLEKISGVSINGNGENCVPHILNVSFNGINGELINSLLQAKMAVASGAACDSNLPEPSHVLKALGLSADNAESSVRFSIGRYTTDQDIIEVLDFILAKISSI